MLSANHALVVARLILPGGVDKGIHSFIVPLRSLDDHRLLPGVVTRDIGPKIAFNSMDNGCLELHGVREGRPVSDLCDPWPPTLSCLISGALAHYPDVGGR